MTVAMTLPRTQNMGSSRIVQLKEGNETNESINGKNAIRRHGHHFNASSCRRIKVQHENRRVEAATHMQY